MVIQGLEIRQGHGASSIRKLEISSVYLLEVQSKMLETVSTKVMDCF